MSREQSKIDQQKELERKKKLDLQLRKERQQLAVVLSTEEGRGVIRRMLKRGKLYSTDMRFDPNEKLWQAGARHSSIKLLNEVLAIPEAYQKMMAENNDEEGELE